MGEIWNTERHLRGVACISGATRVAELAGRIGFDVVWIDVEHGSIPSGQVEAMCVATERGGAIPLVRVPDAERRHILWALEWGARIVVVPMVNDAATAQRVVEHGKFAPLGRRGFNTRSRGLQFGLGKVPAIFDEANQATYLFGQIETREAVENIDAICAVEGLTGIFIGPGDLSVSYGCTGEITNPQIVEASVHCIRRALAHGKRGAILAPAGPLQEAAIGAGASMVIVGSDMGDLAMYWRKLLDGAA